MIDLLKKALAAKRESKQVEFKESFDPTSPGEWCELVKDIAAIANSGGGVIVFGLDSLGTPRGGSVDAIARIDPADISNKLSKYAGSADVNFEVTHASKDGQLLVAFVVEAATIPLVFEKPGTYDIGSGKQRTAFGVGTVWFRHGAKSEPGTSQDIRKSIERQLEGIRKSWLKGVRRVTEAPPGSRIVALPGNSKHILADHVRAVNDAGAVPVTLTRDLSLASGTFLHEEISEGIFDEVNNVVDANRILARGQGFALSQPVYYRIYADRSHLHQPDNIIASLLHCGVAEFYAPSLYWARSLSDNSVASLLTGLIFCPTNRHAHSLMRIGLLLGASFCEWLYGKWNDKWRNHTQPPSFYWTFKRTITELRQKDPLLLAARLNATSRIELKGSSAITVREILSSGKGAELVSQACMRVIEGDHSCRGVARDLDYLTYGSELQHRADSIGKAVIDIVAQRPVGDVMVAEEEE